MKWNCLHDLQVEFMDHFLCHVRQEFVEVQQVRFRYLMLKALLSNTFLNQNLIFDRAKYPRELSFTPFKKVPYLQKKNFISRDNIPFVFKMQTRSKRKKEEGLKCNG